MPRGTEELRSVQEEEGGLEVDASIENQTEETEPPKNESARETVERLLRESSSGDGSEGEESEKADDDEIKVEKSPLEALSEDIPEKPAKKSKEEEIEIDRDLLPPARFDAIEKETFEKLPKRLKKAVNKAISDLQGVTTRAAQHYAQAANEMRAVGEAIQPFVGKWAKRGFTAPAAIAALAATFDELNNPDTALETWLSIGKDIGVNPEMLEGFQGSSSGGGNSSVDISTHPQFLALQNELKNVSNYVNASRQQQMQSTTASIVAELAAVRDEKDSTGRYRFPELHDDSFLDRVKPLVEALRKTSPELSFGDTLKRAYFTLTGKSDFSQTNPSRLPAQTSNVIRTAQAPVSVRGRSAPSQVMAGDIPQEALSKDPRDSVRWALESLKRGS